MSRALKSVNVLSLEQFRFYLRQTFDCECLEGRVLVADLARFFVAGIIIPRLRSKVHHVSSMHYLRLPLDKLFVDLFVDPIKPLFGAVRPIAVSKKLFLQLRNAIPGGAQLACNLLRRFYHVLGVFFCNPRRLTNQLQNRVTRSVELVCVTTVRR